MNLFDNTSYLYQKEKEWAGGKDAFVRQTGFTLMAAMSPLYDQKAFDAQPISFFPFIKICS